MALRRRDTELTVERPIDPGNPSAGAVRLSARFEPPANGSAPSPAELAEALDALKADLEALVGPLLAAAPAMRPDRDRDELIETYRPRQRELVDALLGDGEITRGEHATLVEYLAGNPPAPASTPSAPEPMFDRPIAAVPISVDRSSPLPRPVPELLRQYEITSLKQAGAVRARREISFEEYMALKRHFQREAPPAPTTAG